MVPKQQVHKNIHMQHGLQGFMKSSKLSHFMGILLFGAIVLSGCNKHHTKAMTSESNGLGRGTPSRSKSSGGLSCIFCCSTSVLDAVNDTSGKFPTTTSNSPEVNAGGVFQTVNLSTVEGGEEVEAIEKPVQEQRNTESEEISEIQEAQESTPIDDPRGDSSKIPSAPGDEEQQSAAAENTDVDAPNLSSELEEENLNNNGVTYPAETIAASVVESDRSQHARQGSEDRSTKSLSNISGSDVPPPLNRTMQDRNDENESLNSSIASSCSIGLILPEEVQNDWNRPKMSSKSVSAIPEQQHAPKGSGDKRSTQSLPDISRPYVFTLSKRTSRNRNDENESVYSSIVSSCSIGPILPEEVQNDCSRSTMSSKSVSAILEQQHAPKGSGGRNKRSTQSLPDVSRPYVSTLSKRTSRDRNDENESVNSSIVTATDLTTDQNGVIMVEEHGDITKTLYAVEVGSLFRDSKKIPKSVQSAPIGKKHKTIIKGNSSRKSAPGVHVNASANKLGVLAKRLREEVAKKEEQFEDLLSHIEIEIESVVNGSNEGDVMRFVADSSNSQEEENDTTNTVGDHKEHTEAEETGHREQKEE